MLPPLTGMWEKRKNWHKHIKRQLLNNYIQLLHELTIKSTHCYSHVATSARTWTCSRGAKHVLAEDFVTTQYTVHLRSTIDRKPTHVCSFIFPKHVSLRHATSLKGHVIQISFLVLSRQLPQKTLRVLVLATLLCRQREYVAQKHLEIFTEDVKIQMTPDKRCWYYHLSQPQLCTPSNKLYQRLHFFPLSGNI